MKMDNAGTDGADSRKTDAATPPDEWLTSDERRIWQLEGFDQLPRTLSVTEAANLIGVSRSSGYKSVEQGDIDGRRVGGRIRVTRYEVFRVLYGVRSTSLA